LLFSLFEVGGLFAIVNDLWGEGNILMALLERGGGLGWFVGECYCVWVVDWVIMVDVCDISGMVFFDFIRGSILSFKIAHHFYNMNFLIELNLF
jgi:hypothetical protein